MRLAICQMSDTPQIESTAVMLRHAGYEVKVCGQQLRNELHRIGCDTVLSVQQMVSLGYDPLDPSIGEASLRDMEKCDLFVEIKVRNIPKIRERWPHLLDKIAWWRVNGAQPEICPKGGDEVNLTCPVITACLWYGTPRYRRGRADQGQSSLEHITSRPVTYEELRKIHSEMTTGDNGLAYTFWPPYPRKGEYLSIDRSKLDDYRGSYCLAHSARAWGYGQIIDECNDLGVRIFGNGAPMGQISHRGVAELAAKSKALVHLKSVDCPGWALYEAMLSGCPVITGRLLNSRMLAYDLLEHGETCYEFGVPASLEYGRGDMDFPKCIADIREALDKLSDREENLQIGENGRLRLQELMWREDRDGDSFLSFMRRNFH